MIHFLDSHPILHYAIFAACAAMAAYTVVTWLCKEDETLGELREEIGQAGNALAGYGFVVLPKIFQYISCAEYAKAIKETLTELAAFVKNPTQWVENELATVLSNMAKTATGLALLQKAVAGAPQSTSATASASTAAATASGSK